MGTLATCSLTALTLLSVANSYAQPSVANSSMETSTSHHLTKAERLARRQTEIDQLLRAKHEARARGLPEPMTTLTVVTGKGRMELPMDEKSAGKAIKLIKQGKLQPQELMPVSPGNRYGHAVSDSPTANEGNIDRLDNETKHRQRIREVLKSRTSSE